jgi:hypothetical protein
MGERIELTDFLTYLKDVVYGGVAHVLDSGKAETNFIFNDGEYFSAFVDIGRQDFDACVTALRNIFDYLIRVVYFVGEHGGEIVDRVVRLEIRRLVCDEAVGGTVGFDENLFPKRDLNCIFFRYAEISFDFERNNVRYFASSSGIFLLMAFPEYRIL